MAEKNLIFSCLLIILQISNLILNSKIWKQESSINYMGKVKNIIFDFDGTLADTSKLIVATMQKSIRDYGLPFKNEEQIKSTIGVRLEEIPAILWPSFKNVGEPFAKIYRKNFEELKDKTAIDLFHGVNETLGKLKDEGYQMAVATSRSHKSVEELTKELRIRDCFVYLLGGDDVSEGKPHAESIYKILKERDWNKEETMMIGDMGVDIKMGKNAGIKTCGVTYGNGKVLELEGAGADYVIPCFQDLLTII